MDDPIRAIIEAERRLRNNGLEPIRLDLDPDSVDTLANDDRISRVDGNTIEEDEFRDYVARVSSIDVYQEKGLKGVPERGRMIADNGDVVTIDEDGEIRE